MACARRRAALKCAGNVGRRDDESVAGALNEPLFELVGDVLGAAHHCPRALAARDIEEIAHDLHSNG